MNYHDLNLYYDLLIRYGVTADEIAAEAARK